MCEEKVEAGCSCEPVNEEFTFENFAVGDSNKLAYELALDVAKGENNIRYNLLHIYGGHGYGKTHLLKAICHSVEQRTPALKAIYVSCNDFCDDLFLHLRKNVYENFREKYCSVDILLMDDIHLLTGKRGIQQELRYIYNTLRELGKQMIFTSDKPIGELFHIEDTLRTRLISGIQTQIQPPDYALSTAIIQSFAYRHNVVLPDDVVDYMADNYSLNKNIYRLEAVVKMIVARSNLGENITVNMLRVPLKADIWVNM